MIELKRIAENKDGTFGVLIKGGMPLCVTLEDKWVNNKRNVSCVPEGEYLVEKYSGTKYKDVWMIMNVPDRSAILIHAGNTHENTEGCVLCAKKYGKLGGIGAILDSRNAIKMLRRELPDRFKLIIRSI